MKILLVDDESDILEQAEIFLKKEEDRLNIETAGSAEKALEMLNNSEYDAIVSDYQMPEMNGLEFLEVVRNDRDSDIPFIIFTGKGREEVAIKALNLGADRYLQKGGSPKTQYGVLAQAIVQEVRHHQAERERDLARKEWQKTFDALPDIACLISPDFEFLRINEKGAQALGMEKEEIIGKKCYEIVHDQDSPIDACPCEKVLKTGEADVGEEFEENGRHYIAAAAPVLDETGEVEAFAHTVKDITERIEAEEEKKEALNDKERIMNTVPDVVYQLDEEGRIVEWNDELVEVSGYSPQELEDMHAIDFFPDKQGEKISNTIETAFQEGFARVEASFMTKSGEEIPYSFTATPIKDEKGELVGLTGVGRDISERKESEERREFLHSLLRHDVRNKAQTVLGYLELAEDYDIPKELEDFLSKARKATEEGIKVIEKVRAFKKISDEEEAEEVELHSLVEDAILKHEEIFSREEIALKCSKEEVKVMGGPLLKELFSNLLENTVRHANCDNVRIDTEERNQEIVVTVEDDGKGIPDEDKDKIFERGFKSEDTGGSGLGMYLVKQIIENYEGSIEVKDSELDGARFDVILKKT